MSNNRIKEHPILPMIERPEITFYWNKTPLKAKKGEVISSALFASNITIFGHHFKDGSAQGIFCANGQCAKCAVIANGIPVKSCMTEVSENMFIESVEGLPKLPDVQEKPNISDIELIETEVLIIGGGPAGLSAAIQLGNHGIQTLVIDDKSEPGGKLVLQTHKFFGSVEDSYAGTRGNAIGRMLTEKVLRLNPPEKGEQKGVEVWTNSIALYVFKDKTVGILKDGIYKLVAPRIVLNTAGAREKFLRFKGNSLAGIYGAGAFQTLVNRDLVRPSKRLFIIGGGNVGLIAGYHALQAGIEVVGLAEALPECGGYKVHTDKLKRLGVPIYTSHTITAAKGEESVSEIMISKIDENFKVIAGTEKSFGCDTVLIAVGLESVSEFTEEAKTAGLKVYSAGDAFEIAEASSAMFNGKIAGLKITRELREHIEDIPQNWYEKAEILKAEPGKISEMKIPDLNEGVFPMVFCVQEIPCNPCCTVCPTDSIFIKGDPIMDLPVYEGKCIGCGKCVAICPGLAITLVDYRKDAEFPFVTIPYEVSNHKVKKGDPVECVDMDGNFLEKCEIIEIKENKLTDKAQLIKLKVPKKIAKKVVSFKIQVDEVSKPLSEISDKKTDKEMVCLCERVTADEARNMIRKGITDMNQLKALLRTGMGPCGAKSCDNLIKQIFKEERILSQKIEFNTRRPLFIEVPLGKFSAGGSHE